MSRVSMLEYGMQIRKRDNFTVGIFSFSLSRSKSNILWMNLSCHITAKCDQRLVLDVLLQSTKTIFSGLENVIVFADSEAKVVLSDVLVHTSVELGGRDGSNTDFVNQEPAQLEVTRAAGNVGRELVVVRQLDRRHVDEDEIATLGVGVLSRLDTVYCIWGRGGKGSERTGTPSSLKTSQKRSILPFISARLSSQNPTLSACSKATAAASWRGDTLL